MDVGAQWIQRKKTKPLMIGSVGIGGTYPVSIQSMTDTDTRDVKSTMAQINRLADAGCEIVRVAVVDEQAAACLGDIVRLSPLPVIADIHFDYRLAVESIKQGVHGLRLNPGNIGARWKVEEVIRAARERKLPIRIGVNGGSLEKDLLNKYGSPTPDAIVESALNHVRILEELNYEWIKIALKVSSVPVTIQAYRKISELVDYPLHLGVTEAGLPDTGTVKSVLGIGTLLAEGIGDTIRVSLTGDPVSEIPVARQILRGLGLLIQDGVEIISCPACGRCSVNLAALAREVQERTADIKKPMTIAVMGCIVNGPGEAREADFGVTGGNGQGLIFIKGQVVKKTPEHMIVDELMTVINESMS